MREFLGLFIPQELPPSREQSPQKSIDPTQSSDSAKHVDQDNSGPQCYHVLRYAKWFGTISSETRSREAEINIRNDLSSGVSVLKRRGGVGWLWPQTRFVKNGWTAKSDRPVRASVVGY